MSLSLTWAIFLNSLAKVQIKYELDVHSFVLMPNHFHLIISPRLISPPVLETDSLGEALKSFYNCINKEFDFLAAPAPFDKNTFFIKRISSFKAYQETYKYIYRNPVMDGYTRKVEEYYYSSLYHLLRGQNDTVNFEDNMNLFTNTCKVLQWLNRDSQSLYFHYH